MMELPSNSQCARISSVLAHKVCQAKRTLNLDLHFQSFHSLGASDVAQRHKNNYWRLKMIHVVIKKIINKITKTMAIVKNVC